MGKIRLGMRVPVSMQQFWSFRSEKSKDDQSSDDGSPRSVLPKHGQLSPLDEHLSLKVSCGRGSGRVHPSVDACNSPINHKAVDISHPAVASSRRRVYASGAGTLKGGKLRPKSLALACSSDAEKILKENVAGKREMLPTDVGKIRESIPVRKVSVDPYTDYRESMLEMIMEKRLDSLEDLEELLQCYLTLNPPELHDTIVEAFTDLCS